jgi:hypothetical protein
MNKITRDDTEHGVEYVRDDDDTQEYAHQRHWVNLTDEELKDLTAIYSGVVLYRAIENKLRERNT